MALPAEVRRFFGHALHFAQFGDRHDAAKVLKGFGDSGVLELVEDDSAGTYRAVYTVQFAEAVFVLHCASRPANELTAWTIHFQEPFLNIFLNGDNETGAVTGRVFSDNVKELPENIFYADVVRGTEPSRRSTVPSFRILSCSRINPSSRASGRGGHPGIATSTGM